MLVENRLELGADPGIVDMVNVGLDEEELETESAGAPPFVEQARTKLAAAGLGGSMVRIYLLLLKGIKDWKAGVFTDETKIEMVDTMIAIGRGFWFNRSKR